MGYFYPEVYWRVVTARGNKNGILFYNVFHHAAFSCEVAKALMCRIGRQQISEKIKRSAHYYFWCKCEWEVVVSDWPRQNIETKIDVYCQLEANWEQFIDYIIKNKKALVKWYKDSNYDY